MEENFEAVESFKHDSKGRYMFGKFGKALLFKTYFDIKYACMSKTICV
jgi:hypothetical protein